MLGLRALAGSVAAVDQGTVTIVPGLGALAGTGAAIDECDYTVVLGVRALDSPGLAVVRGRLSVGGGVTPGEDGCGDPWLGGAQEGLGSLGGLVAELGGVVSPVGRAVALAG